MTKNDGHAGGHMTNVDRILRETVTVVHESVHKSEPSEPYAVTPQICYLCGAAVGGAALFVQQSADRAGKLDHWRCRTHLIEETDQLMVAIRAHRETGE